ncbi:MAG: hypothetical protein IJK02_04575 [Clostridia bacterium]|nr:hypothetical protein [Clostridia bacterium]MBR0509204.1 hypothetical protein [Clostridia bacterium]
MNFSIIYNPIATRFSQTALDHLVFRLAKKGFTLYTIAESEYSGHVIELIKELDPVSDYIFTLGGDGTFNEAVRAFHDIEQHCIYSHVSTGTTNDMANNFHLDRKDPIKAIDKLIDKGVETQIDSIVVNGESVCYVSSFGYVAPIPYLVNTKLKKKLGHAAYVVSALPILSRRPEKIRMEVTANGETKEITASLVLVTTSKGTGGITLYPNVDMNDGKFEAFFLEKLTPALVARIFPQYLTDSIDLREYSFCSSYFSASEMTIRFPDGLPKYPLDNDGNKAGFTLTPENNVLHYTIGKKIRVLRPEA